MLTTALLSSVLFFLSLLGLFFVPGYILLRFIFQKTDFSLFEEVLLTFGIGLGLLDATLLFLGRLNIPLSANSLFLGLFILLVVFFGISKIFRMFSKKTDRPASSSSLFKLSTSGLLLFSILFGATLLIKTVYFKDAVLPSSTDLGHHMYWAKSIATSGTLPTYAKVDVVTDEKNDSHISAPAPIADFIIGEHLPFAAIALVSKLDFFSAFPIIFLSFIGLFSLFAYALFAWHVAHSLGYTERQSEFIFLFTFFIIGPLYALASPQAKYVSGGVVGNVFGNFFIPVVLLLFLRALEEKKSFLLALGLFLACVLAYTHHLSTLILIFALLGGILLTLAATWSRFTETLLEWWRLLRTPPVLLVLFGIFLFLLFIALPTYLDIKTIDTAVGTPTKATRTGLTFLQATNSIGMARIGLGLVGLLFLAFRSTRTKIGTTLLAGWTVMLLIMTLHPGWVLLDIPSDRLVTYLSFPIAILAAFSLTELFRILRSGASDNTSTVPALEMAALVGILLVFFIGNGSSENSSTLLSKSKATEITQTQAVSRYLSEHVSPNDIILKDHNYISGDSWMKLFFMRDYNYPLSRGFFTRYEAGGRRTERCTLNMISIPNTPDGKKCFEDTGTRFVVVNPVYDSAQFEKSESFALWYSSDTIHLYERK